MAPSDPARTTPDWALVTGASSGLGVAFAEALAERGCNLVLVARREAEMRALAETLERRHRVRVVVHARDLGQPGSAMALQQDLAAASIEIAILINNAAFAISGPFIDQDTARLRAMVELNIIALTELTHTFGRQMMLRGGRILLVGSVGAYTPSPLAAAYSATKAYVLSLGVALSVEFAPHVSVTVVSPGLMETEFHRVAEFSIKQSMRSSILPVEKVAAIGLDAMFAGRSSVVAGQLNRIGAFGSRLLPRSTLARMAYRVSKV